MSNKNKNGPVPMEIDHEGPSDGVLRGVKKFLKFKQHMREKGDLQQRVSTLKKGMRDHKGKFDALKARFEDCMRERRRLLDALIEARGQAPQASPRTPLAPPPPPPPVAAAPPLPRPTPANGPSTSGAGPSSRPTPANGPSTSGAGPSSRRTPAGPSSHYMDELRNVLDKWGKNQHSTSIKNVIKTQKNKSK